MKKGYVQIYTGPGKGKTTASLGLILRALGAGYSVFMGQFLKNGNYGEIKMLGKMKGLLSPSQNLKVEQYGEPSFVGNEPSSRDRAGACRGWEAVKKALHSGLYDMVVAEELNVALSMGLLPLDEVLEEIACKDEKVELVITGRGAPDALREAADLVSVIHDEKHYYKVGVSARKGIEM